MTALHPLVDRLARAVQDCRTVFGEATTRTLPDGSTVTTVPIAHAPGPQTEAERAAARAAIQREANLLATHGRYTEARALLHGAAVAEYAAHPQYDGYWDGYVLGVALRHLTPMSGDIDAGDVLLIASGDDGWTVYNARSGWNVAVRDDDAVPCPDWL